MVRAYTTRLGFLFAPCVTLAQRIITYLGRRPRTIIISRDGRPGHMNRRHTLTRRLAIRKLRGPIVFFRRCTRSATRSLRIGTNTSVKTLVFSKLYSKVCLFGRNGLDRTIVSTATFKVLRTKHVHADGARCVSYPKYKQALFGLRDAVTHIGRTASRLGKLGVNVVKYVIGKPNRVTSTSCNCMKTKHNGVDLCGRGRYVRGGVPRRRTMRGLVRLVGTGKSCRRGASSLSSPGRGRSG